MAKLLFINGQFVDSVLKERLTIINPATEEEICKVAAAGEADINLAVSAAEAAFPKWTALGVRERQRLILKLADLIERDANSLGALESLNNGGPLPLQTAIVTGLPGSIRYYAGFADKIEGRTPATDSSLHVYTKRVPLGVCGIIVPWNVPLWATITKLVPCLVGGNTAVIKPAESTPLTALKLAELINEAGFPPGVVNIVPGYGPAAGSPLALHPRVAKIAFTGSTGVGRQIMKMAADSNIKLVQLELGGKSPFVVLPDANIDMAVEIAYAALFSNNGQLCTAGSRTYVHESMYDAFVKKAVARAQKSKVGDQAKSDIGPLVNRNQLNKVLSCIEKGKQEGAKLECGGHRVGTKGFFVAPTVFSNVTDQMTIAKEEIFGPVQSIIKYSTFEEAMDRANDTSYGLAAAVITSSISAAHQFADKVKAGTIWVNTYHVILPNAPFGGFGASGFGREGGSELVEEWTQSKTVIVSLPPANL